MAWGTSSWGARAWGHGSAAPLPPATTTFAAIRNALIDTIRQLIPSRMEMRRFRLADDTSSADFRIWSEDNAHACLRRYTIRHLGWEPAGVSDVYTEMRQSEAELVVAYHHAWGEYRDGTQPRNMLDMEDLIEADLGQIAQAIGYRSSHSYPLGTYRVIETGQSIEVGAEVSFGVISLVADYLYGG